jgi:DNA-binding transcriptional MocR family regulator
MNDVPMPVAALSRAADRTLTEQLSARFAERIRQRLLAPGARLPSVRECARRHGVSPTTVVAAYDQLQGQGLVEARRQRGFFVRDSLAEGSRSAAARGAERVARAPLPVSATTLIRGMFQSAGGLPMPALGTLPLEWLDSAAIAGALKRVASGAMLAPLALQYGEPAGDSRLRRALATRLADHGIAASAAQIVTTLGATQALDIVTRTLTKPGDAVLVDEPGWSVEYARLAALGLRVLPVPRGEDGPDLAVMQRLLEAHRPRLYVTVSVLHNPTGASLTLQAAHRVLQLAQAHDLHIVEDDTYAHLAPAHLPRLSALDALERTIYVSGFSKILAPGLRVGYLAAPAPLVDRLVDTKLLTTLTTPALTEQALAHCLEHGLLRRHAERIAQRLDAARARSVRLAQAHGVRFAAPPRGLFGWVDVGIDTERLAQAMFEDGWLLAPGALFHATPRPTCLMRINFATTQDARFWRALDKARSGH